MPPDSHVNGDAYRTLGLQPGATKAEVKRAYRLLAKAFHPDSAGEAALPRFLAIHEAYDRLMTGRVPPSPKAARPDAAEPWRADPARARQARQARERARTARNGATGPGRGPAGAASSARPGTGGGRGTAGTDGGRGAPGASGTSGAAGPGSSGSRASGSSSSGTRGGPGTRAAGRRPVRKATMGSTSYDEARDANDPTWSGASWYGPSSGEYWIVNPREFADPRKHGPEYQSRARRPLPGEGSSSGPDAVASAATGAADRPIAAAWTAASPRADVPPRPSRWGTSPSASSWTAPADDRPAAPATARRPRRAAGEDAGDARAANAHESRHPASAAAAPESFDIGSSIGVAGRAWLGGAPDDPVRRFGLALVAWPPIGLAAATLIGQATGCAAYSASCTGTQPLLPWLAQAGILGVLLLLPPLTRLLAAGALAVLLALVPLTLLLVAFGGTGALGGLVGGALLGAAWLAGVAWAATRARSQGPGQTRAGA